MVVYPNKFNIRQTISYGGFVLEAKNNAPIKILPDGSRLKELIDLIPPSSKTELHSFLGLINTFKTWSPAISPHTPYLRSLAKKDALFKWTPEAQSEFDQVKRDLSSVLEINPYDPNLPLIIYSDASFTAGFGFIMGQ